MSFFGLNHNYHRNFKANLNKPFLEPGQFLCRVPRGSILGPLRFLLYIKNMPQAVKCELLLYKDEICLIFQHIGINEIEMQLNKNFSSTCDWFVDNKLSIHFSDDKITSIFISSKSKIKKASPLTIQYKGKKVKQYSKPTYLGCIFDEHLSGKSIATHVINRVSCRLRFLYRQNKFLYIPLHGLFFNAMLQPFFNYACHAWYPNLNKNLKTNLPATPNKCITFCLKLGDRKSIKIKEFLKKNWLPIPERINKCILSCIYKFDAKKHRLYG